MNMYKCILVCVYCLHILIEIPRAVRFSLFQFFFIGGGGGVGCVWGGSILPPPPRTRMLSFFYS